MEWCLPDCCEPFIRNRYWEHCAQHGPWPPRQRSFWERLWEAGEQVVDVTAGELPQPPYDWRRKAANNFYWGTLGVMGCAGLAYWQKSWWPLLGILPFGVLNLFPATVILGWAEIAEDED